MSDIILRAVLLVVVMNFIVPVAAAPADPCANLTGQARDDCVKQGASTGSKAQRSPVDVDAPERHVRELALADDKVQTWVGGRTIDRVVVVPNRLVNIVTRP